MEGVVGWFERRGEIPLIAPPGIREYGPIADDPDRPDESFLSQAIRGVAFGMEYSDSRGWASTRAIRCLAVDPQHPAYLKAFCNVRGEPRTFRVDRIISVFDYRTGEMLDGDEHVTLLAPYLADRHSDRQCRNLAEVQEVTKDGVFALLQLAMAEGRLEDTQREIVLDYIYAETRAEESAVPAVEVVELWLDNLAPPRHAIVTAATNLLSKKEKLVRVLPFLLKIVRSNGSLADEEESVRELIEAVRRHFRRKLLRPSPFRRAIR